MYSKRIPFNYKRDQFSILKILNIKTDLKNSNFKNKTNKEIKKELNEKDLLEVLKIDLFRENLLKIS
jgi:hypothetical protein